jgi:hypothetical protein
MKAKKGKDSPMKTVIKRVNTVSHIIEALHRGEKHLKRWLRKTLTTITDFVVSDMEDEAEDKGTGTDKDQPQASGSGTTSKKQGETEPRSSSSGPASNEQGEAKGVNIRADDDDSDWETDGETTGTGSSDLFSAEEESLGYITSEDSSSLGEIVNQAIVETTLEGLKVVGDNEGLLTERTKKRFTLQNSSLADLRWMQLKKLVDKVDTGTVLLDRLDEELQRIGSNAVSLLRMMELTDTLASGLFLLPLMKRGACVME